MHFHLPPPNHHQVQLNKIRCCRSKIDIVLEFPVLIQQQRPKHHPWLLVRIRQQRISCIVFINNLCLDPLACLAFFCKKLMLFFVVFPINFISSIFCCPTICCSLCCISSHIFPSPLSPNRSDGTNTAERIAHGLRTHSLLQRIPCKPSDPGASDRRIQSGICRNGSEKQQNGSKRHWRGGRGKWIKNWKFVAAPKKLLFRTPILLLFAQEFWSCLSRQQQRIGRAMPSAAGTAHWQWIVAWWAMHAEGDTNCEWIFKKKVRHLVFKNWIIFSKFYHNIFTFIFKQLILSEFIKRSIAYGVSSINHRPPPSIPK